MPLFFLINTSKIRTQTSPHQAVWCKCLPHASLCFRIVWANIFVRSVHPQKWPSKWKASLVFSSFLVGATKVRLERRAVWMCDQFARYESPATRATPGHSNPSPSPGFSASQVCDLGSQTAPCASASPSCKGLSAWTLSTGSVNNLTPICPASEYQACARRWRISTGSLVPQLS